jgi:hypothetical protein
MEPEMSYEVQLELNLILDENDLDKEFLPSKEEIINYLNRKLRVSNGLLGKITEKNVIKITQKNYEKI